MIDISICFVSFMVAYQVRFNFDVPDHEIRHWRVALPVVLGVRTAGFILSRTYYGLIRYTNSRDALRIFNSIVAGTLVIAAANSVSYLTSGSYLVPFSILIIDSVFSVFALAAFRASVRMIYQELTNPSKGKRAVIIYGAGEAGVITKRTLDRDAGSRFKVIAYVDDDPAKSGKTLEGIRIYDTEEELDGLLRANSVDQLIISIQDFPAGKRQELVDRCSPFRVNVHKVPPVSSWINGELQFSQIRNLKIEDLLERDPILLHTDLIRKELNGKTILVTGGAGSIGSEIVRQLLAYSPRKIVALDQAESALYDLELQITEIHGHDILETVIADVRQTERMRRVFEAFRPEIVFHAAAYKHVPVMENNPSEAILTNVHGTRTVADLADEFHAGKFILVSTDKAVNPTNIMGATKRIAEIYCQSLGRISSTLFITTRFGNVLGSNGSVIPRFRKQIEEGGPVTVTHPEITRYFMTIPEACQLVLEAASAGKGGEIFIFNMGTSVRIADLAKKMIRLAGLTEDRDIKIVYTGLRPGEKIYEELLADAEKTVPTHHDKILIAKVREYDFAVIRKDIDELIGLFGTQKNDLIVSKMKSIVPEFVSANSVYEKLDAGEG
ncbi:MAG: hypothetical protein RL213_11 [Bacteroidota bacterium]|jgi:FlaA1/EpsC-like NDP-sugar epimerase